MRGWRFYLTRDEAAFLKPLEKRRREIRKELLEIYAKAYPIQNRATQRRRAAVKAEAS